MDLEKELKKIKQRNKAVEGHKAWETSVFRRVILAVFTYGVAFLFMWVVELEKAWIAAFVPAGAYLISTITASPLREWWVKNYFRS
jgi:hypothetical protein